MYLWLLLLHMLAVLLLAVGDIGSLLAAIRARRATTTIEVLTYMRMHHFTVMSGIIPGAIGSLVTGAALVHTLGLSFAAPWIVASFAAWLASLLIGVGLLVPAERRALREAERLHGEKNAVPNDTLRRSIGAPVVWVSEWATVVLLVALTALMVFKPAW